MIFPKRALLLKSNIQPVSDPSGANTFYSWLPFRIYPNGDGTFNTGGFDLKKYSGCGLAGDKYVDVVNGDNSNDGNSWGQAYKDIWKAAAVPGVTVHIAEGTYFFNNSYGGWQGAPNKATAFIGYGTVEMAMCIATVALTWALDGNHYEASTATDYEIVWDETVVDENGCESILTEVEDEPTCDATPGSWYNDQDGNVLHIRTWDDREPDSDIWLGRKNGALTIATTWPVYFENITFSHGPHRNLRAYGVGTQVFAKDCIFEQAGSGTDIIDLDGISLTILENCTVRYSASGGDGIDYGEYGGVECHGVEINCHVHNIRGNSNDQCSTAHDTSKVVRINGEYQDSQSQIMAEDDAGHAIWMLGCYLHDSDAGYGYWGANAWLDSVRIGEMSIDEINVPAGGTVRIRNLTWTENSGGAGTIEDY